MNNAILKQSEEIKKMMPETTRPPTELVPSEDANTKRNIPFNSLFRKYSQF